jgi:hypothetical protein
MCADKEFEDAVPPVVNSIDVCWSGEERTHAQLVHTVWRISRTGLSGDSCVCPTGVTLTSWCWLKWSACNHVHKVVFMQPCSQVGADWSGLHAAVFTSWCWLKWSLCKPSLFLCGTSRRTARSYKAHTQLLIRRTTPCRLHATAYSVLRSYPPYLEAVSSIRNARTRRVVLTGTHLMKQRECRWWQQSAEMFGVGAWRTILGQLRACRFTWGPKQTLRLRLNTNYKHLATTSLLTN